MSGLKGKSNKRLISMSEVKQHQKGDSMWTVLKGRVYNLSPYMRFHPGGMDMILFCSSFKDLLMYVTRTFSMNLKVV